MKTPNGVFGIASPEDQAKIDKIFAEASSLPQVNHPKDTTRTPAEIDLDTHHMRDIIARYDAAVLAATGCPFLQDGKPYDSMHYQLSGYLYEHKFAVNKGN